MQNLEPVMQKFKEYESKKAFYATELDTFEKGKLKLAEFRVDELSSLLKAEEANLSKLEAGIHDIRSSIKVKEQKISQARISVKKLKRRTRKAHDVGDRLEKEIIQAEVYSNIMPNSIELFRCT